MEQVNLSLGPVLWPSRPGLPEADRTVATAILTHIQAVPTSSHSFSSSFPVSHTKAGLPAQIQQSRGNTRGETSASRV